MTEGMPKTRAIGMPVVNNTNIDTAGPRGPALLQDVWLIEKLARFVREVIPERRMPAKDWGASRAAKGKPAAAAGQCDDHGTGSQGERA